MCEKLSRRQYEYIRDNNIRKVFLVARWSLYTDGEYNKKMESYFLVSKEKDALTIENSREVFCKALTDTVDAYRKLGVDVILILQIPQQKLQPNSLYSQIYEYEKNDTDEATEAVNNLSISLTEHLNLQEFNRMVIFDTVSKLGGAVINVDSYFCNSFVCAMGNAVNSYYLDDDHVNRKGAMIIEGELKKYFN